MAVVVAFSSEEPELSVEVRQSPLIAGFELGKIGLEFPLTSGTAVEVVAESVTGVASVD